ncbi:N-acyl-aromatic-L-amino acid amidohydrolase (carboxylate-forming)-like [Protopterus annectens]|uniref:N-acyl-aromatic-L-amino acid amidohydrolase (carboxylate-forming)-like n=1 Tax=Protopterus annectens TaxID=7888 RepID=UPI001CFA32E0|nr:N-acyl-aromatic-L-amino acid amidohydrolase (carboxylate-forming)-like [Protopterus annectens]
MSVVVTYPALKRVALAGGTHGNEMAGVVLAKYWMKNPAELQRKTFIGNTFISNPRATEKCVRYIDFDLNRCFTSKMLNTSATEDPSYELSRAKELNKIYGPKGSSDAFDLLIDMHNTTSNIGNCFIPMATQDHLTMQMLNYVQQQSLFSPCRAFIADLPLEDAFSLDCVGLHGLSFELGPQPQGVIRGEILQRMRGLVNCAYDFIDLFNQGQHFSECQVEGFQVTEKVDFPRNADGEIEAVIHPDLQDKDFLPLHPGDPIFLTLDGETITYNGDSVVYPVFINEAAYYEKKLAFWKTKKITVTVPPIQVQKN